MKAFASFLVWAFLIPTIAFSQKMITVTGTVKDEKGSPVAGASVQGKEKNIGTATDSSGNFKIRLRTGDPMYVNAVGFESDTLKVADNSGLSIVLRTRIKILEGIVITGSDQKAAGGNDPLNTIAAKSAGATLSEFVRTELSYNGGTVVTPRTPLNATTITPSVPGQRSVLNDRLTYTTNAPATNFYSMSALPAFSIKEGTKGSRYLLGDRWGAGVVITQSDSIVDNKALQYNFDKIDQKLYTTSDQHTVIELDKPTVKAFAIKDGDSLMIFDHVAAIDMQRYFIAIIPAAAGKYSLYKNLITKFVKSDFHSDGMAESGNPYDEYKDNIEYYVVLPDGKEYKKVELKKKSIRDALPAATARVDAWLSSHKYDDINETFLKGLITTINQ